MSFDGVIQAIKDNPALAGELRAASTPAERAAVLDLHGIEKPTVNSKFPEMDDTAGGGATETAIVAGSAAAEAAVE